jgi:hypothetical protein
MKKKTIAYLLVSAVIIILASSNVSQFLFLNKTIRSFERIADNALYWNVYIKDKVVLTAKEQFLKHTTRYYQIMGWHSPKPLNPKRRKNMSKKDRQRAGFTTWQKTQISVKSYKREKWIDMPKYTFMGLGFIETCFRPDGPHKGDEIGWLGVAPPAVGQAYIYYKDMKRENPKLAQKLLFYYRGDNDLRDPVNCLNMMTVRLWGLNRLYGGNLKYVIATYHWGLRRIWPLWKGREKFKDEWFFYPRGTDMTKALRKDASSVRNPLQYFFIWSEIRQAWLAGRKDINKETVDYMKRYMAASSEEKRQWIHSWRYVQRLKRALKAVLQRQKALDEGILRAHKTVLETEKKYYEIYGGKKKKKKTVWRKAKGIFWRLVLKFRKITK